MQAMAVEQFGEVGGGFTETQCISAFAAAGGALGAMAGAWSTAGFGGWAGFQGGVLIGGTVGGLICGAETRGRDGMGRGQNNGR